MNAPETFTLDLGDGVRITARVNVAAIANLPDDALPSVVSFGWEGPPHARHWPQYLAWVKTVWQHAADTARKSFITLMAPPDGEPFFIVFEPFQAPEVITLPRP